MTAAILPKTRIKGLLLLAVLFATSSKAQQPVKASAVDTTALSIYWDSSQVKLSKSISDKDYWFHILEEDTTVISFFKTKASNKPCYVYIASIEKVAGNAFQYELMIYSRPAIVQPAELVGFGYAVYQVTLSRLLSGRQIIGEIKFIGIAI